MEWANLFEVNLTRTKLMGANLFAARVERANFTEANLTGAKFIDYLSDVCWVTFNNTIMTDGIMQEGLKFWGD
jgi:uncharacterized protein YjbI with pentapeptide repeats